MHMSLSQIGFYVDSDTPIHITGPAPAFPTVGQLEVGPNYEVSIHAAELDGKKLGVDKLKDIHGWFAFVTGELAKAIHEAGGRTLDEDDVAELNAAVDRFIETAEI